MTASVAVIYQPTKLRDDDITHEVIRGLTSEHVAVVAFPVETAQSRLEELDGFDGMLFGSLSADEFNFGKLDAFIQSTRARYQCGLWRDKVATAFTHSLKLCADSLPLMLQLSQFCAQHNMIWIDEAENTTSSNTNLTACNHSPSGFAYGQRVGQITKQWSTT